MGSAALADSVRAAGSAALKTSSPISSAARDAASRQTAPQRGADLRFDVDISFKQAAFGTEMEIQVPKDETCDRCNGSGAEPGSDVETCPVCHGTGQQRVVQNTPFGQMVNVRTCSHCGGTGKIIKKKCTKCHGDGTVKVRKKLKIKIPAASTTAHVSA